MAKKKAQHKKKTGDGFRFSSFSAPEFEYYEKSPLWFMAMTFINGTIIMMSIIYHYYSLALIVFLITVVVYQLANVKPKKAEYAITIDGLKTGGRILGWENFRNFWLSQTGNHHYLYLQPLNRFSQPIAILVPKNLNIFKLQYQLRLLIPESLRNSLHFSDRLSRLLRI